MKKLQLLLFAIIAFANTYAQKLPKVQQTSLQAPANMKIDGKATEWEGKFQAYNPGSRVFYTLSNDGENLYLIACMEEKNGNFKAVGAGITLTIQPKTATAKKNKDAVIITFPTKEKIENREKIHDNVYWAYSIKDDKRKRDSIRLIANKLMVSAFKQIQVAGLMDVDEPSIPVYNAQGIRVAAQVNEEVQYVYELAIPLKYLHDFIDSAGKLNYSLKVNAPAESGGLMVKDASKLGPDALFQLYSTDFSGEYTLAK
jgi:hypothetical protein